MFKIALNAGHYFYEPGRRILKEFDTNETREWVLNSRICEKVQKLLDAYTGYSLLRIDDPTGETLIKLADRAKKANDFGADVFISVHHNGGIHGGSGGGIMAYTYPSVDQVTKQWQKALYDKLIEKTGLIGNRASPLSSADFAELRLTKMPAVLLECGFMDSSSDAPIILTEAFADKAALAIAEVIAELGGLTKKSPEVEQTDIIYRVQVGAYKVKANAESMRDKLKEKGFDAIIKEEKS